MHGLEDVGAEFRGIQPALDLAARDEGDEAGLLGDDDRDGVRVLRDAEGGVKLDAELSYDLLVTIFNPATPLHDGAVVIRGHRAAAAACFLPLTLNPMLSKDLGTRHRAAIGITEDTDAVAVVVSEETGIISFVQGGHIRRNLDATKLRAAILEALEPPSRRDEEEQAEADNAEVRGQSLEVSKN